MAGHRSVGPRGESVLRPVDWRQPLQQVVAQINAMTTQAQPLRLLPFAGLLYVLVVASSTPENGAFAELSLAPIVQAFVAVAVATFFLVAISTSADDSDGKEPTTTGTDPANRPPHYETQHTATNNRGATDAETISPALAAKSAMGNLRPLSQHSAYAWADLMSQVSHELRTPLNAVIGFSDVINAELHGPLENPKYREYLTHIRDSGRHLLKSTEDTLAMTSLLAGHEGESREMSQFHIDDLASEAWSFVAANADKRGISLHCQSSDDAEALVRHRPLRQTLINLFSAALSLAGDDAEITLHAAVDADVVQVVIAVEVVRDGTPGNGTALPIAIASALCDLQNTDLLTRFCPEGAWSATLSLQRAAQADFFTGSSHADQQSLAVIA